MAASYPDRITLYQELGKIVFPGYGSGNLAQTRQPDGTELLAVGIEIPGTEQDRYVVFRSGGSAFVRVRIPQPASGKRLPASASTRARAASEAPSGRFTR